MTLDNYTVLKQTNRLILDPNLAGEDFSDQRSSFVLIHPQLVPVAIGGAEGVERDVALGLMRHAVDVIRGQTGLIISNIETADGSTVAELLPRTEAPTASGVNDHAEAFVGCYANRESNEEEWSDEEAPPSGFSRKGKNDSKDEAANDMSDTRVSDKENARLVAIADGPPNEVGVGLATEVGFDQVSDRREGGRMRCVLEGMKHGATGPIGEIQFAWGFGGKVVADHSIDLGSERLDRDWAAV